MRFNNLRLRHLPTVVFYKLCRVNVVCVILNSKCVIRVAIVKLSLVVSVLHEVLPVSRPFKSNVAKRSNCPCYGFCYFTFFTKLVVSCNCHDSSF